MTFLEQVQAELSKSPSHISFDIEDNEGRIVMLGFGFSPEIAVQMWIDPDDQDQIDDIKEAFRLVRVSGILLTAFNGEYDVTVLMRYGVRVEFDHDVYTVAKWIWKQPEYGLKPLAVAILGNEARLTIGEMIKKYGSMASIPDEEFLAYNAADCTDTWRLAAVQMEAVKQKKLVMVTKLEAAMATVTAEMHAHGVVIDMSKLDEIKAQLEKEAGELETHLAMLRGSPVYLNVHRDVSKFLFDEMKVPAEGIPVNKSGFHTTNKDYLNALAPEYPVVDQILQWRQIGHVLSTFLPALHIAGADSRVHPNWRSWGTVTGRMGVTSPAFHITPKHHERGRQLRKAVIAPPGYKLVAMDFSQIQLRVLAVLTHAEPMIQMFRDGVDIHSETARIMYRKQVVSKEERQDAKGVNFNLVFGGGPGVFSQFGYSWEEARQLFQDYFTHYGMTQGMLELKKAIWKGHARTFHGRIIALPWVKSTDSSIYIRGIERLAVNYPCQGGEADLLKIGILRISKAFANHFASTRPWLILAIHDELVYEVPDAVLNSFIQVAQSLLESIPFPCPLKVDVEVGQNWYEMEDWHV